MDIRAESADHIKWNLFTELLIKEPFHRQRSILLREEKSGRDHDFPRERVAAPEGVAARASDVSQKGILGAAVAATPAPVQATSLYDNVGKLTVEKVSQEY